MGVSGGAGPRDLPGSFQHWCFVALRFSWPQFSPPSCQALGVGYSIELTMQKRRHQILGVPFQLKSKPLLLMAFCNHPSGTRGCLSMPCPLFLRSAVLHGPKLGKVLPQSLASIPSGVGMFSRCLFIDSILQPLCLDSSFWGR